VNAVRRLACAERGWCRAANRWGARQAVRAYFGAVSRLGDGIFWYALLVALPLLDTRGGLAVSLQLAATGAVSALLYRVLKRWTRRPRPCHADPAIRAWVAPLDEFSFPSGHTLHAVAFTLVTLAHYPMLAWLLVPFALSVAASRVVLGVHYPSDVLAASAIGTGLATASLQLGPVTGL
jgi:undecaprenyl-diphosphatase